MKTYRVWAEYTSRCYIDIEAESEEEAKEIAENAYSGSFDRDYGFMRDWHITNVEED